MTALQFIFYVGWMKVAESLMNPLGEDDDDFVSFSKDFRCFLVPSNPHIFVFRSATICSIAISRYAFNDNTNLDIHFMLQVGLTIVEDSSPPEQQMDIFWSDKVEPLYSADTAAKPIYPLVGSVANVR